uniref:Uncharacterized protein n=1 Tax=Aegilops tauschii subsp. strangulata TaxID=200361 RepID=A0A453FZG0_AEGTS
GRRAAPGVPLLPDGGGADMLLPAQQARWQPRRHRARHPRRRRLLRRPVAALRDPREAVRRRWRRGGAVVLLLRAAGAGGAGRAAEPDHAVGVLEGGGHARGRLLRRPPAHRAEEDHGVLPRPRAVRDQDQVENERVQSIPARARRRRRTHGNRGSPRRCLRSEFSLCRLYTKSGTLRQFDRRPVAAAAGGAAGDIPGPSTAATASPDDGDGSGGSMHPLEEDLMEGAGGDPYGDDIATLAALLYWPTD